MMMVSHMLPPQLVLFGGEISSSFLIHILPLPQCTSIWETLLSFGLMLGSLVVLPDLCVGDYQGFFPLLTMIKSLCMNSSFLRISSQCFPYHCLTRAPWSCKFWKVGFKQKPHHTRCLDLAWQNRRLLCKELLHAYALKFAHNSTM